jgi:hypothetical protein
MRSRRPDSSERAFFSSFSGEGGVRAVQRSQLDRVSRKMPGKKLVPSARFV